MRFVNDGLRPRIPGWLVCIPLEGLVDDVLRWVRKGHPSGKRRVDRDRSLSPKRATRRRCGCALNPGRLTGQALPLPKSNTAGVSAENSEIIPSSPFLGSQRQSRARLNLSALELAVYHARPPDFRQRRIRALVEASCPSWGSACASNSGMMRPASALPSSTPHWSNESILQIAP